MIQTVTIRMQILEALERIKDRITSGDPLSLELVEKELFAEFSPTAYALTPADGFYENAEVTCYFKLESSEVTIKRATAVHCADLLSLEIEANNGTCADCNAALADLTRVLEEKL